jgi:FMN-dependent NADH-azoreductase
MKAVLQLNTSILGDAGESSRLANEFVAQLGAEEVVVRDLAKEPVPHLDAERFGAFIAPAEKRNERQREIVAYSDRLIGEVRRADVLVIGLPMYNFGVPSGFKAWIDHVARAGVTFRYTDKGPVGLLGGKKAYVFATRGGYYAGTKLDTQTQYLRDFLAFVGITDVEFVYAEGLATGEAVKTASLAKAREQLSRLAPAYA